MCCTCMCVIEQRKIASHMFNARNLNNKMERVFTEHAVQFIERLNQQPANEPFDLQGMLLINSYLSIT
jgi:hypothetical protein